MFSNQSHKKAAKFAYQYKELCKIHQLVVGKKMRNLSVDNRKFISSIGLFANQLQKSNKIFFLIERKYRKIRLSVAAKKMRNLLISHRKKLEIFDNWSQEKSTKFADCRKKISLNWLLVAGKKKI